jgi:hypothetical protein
LNEIIPAGEKIKIGCGRDGVVPMNLNQHGTLMV